MLYYREILSKYFMRNERNKKALINNNSRTSGYFFYSALAESLNKHEQKGNRILCNIDCSIYSLIILKLVGKEIVIRCDGIYMDKPEREIAKKVGILNQILLVLTKMTGMTRRYSGVILNVKEAFKLSLSSIIVYQSKFSRDTVIEFIPWLKYKRSRIINNASTIPYSNLEIKERNSNLITCTAIYDVKRARKRTDLLLLSFELMRRKINIGNVELRMIGYDPDQKVPDWFDKEALRILSEKPKWLKFKKRYESPSKGLQNALKGTDFIITLSQYDPCPNYIIECINIGVPIIGVASGGVPEIVGTAGILFADNNYKTQGHREDLIRCGSKWGKDTVNYMSNEISKAIVKGVKEYPIIKANCEEQAMKHLNFDRAMLEYGNLL